MNDSDAWLELSVSAEPEAVESISAAFAEYGQGVALEQAVESSRDGDVVELPPDTPVVVRTYLPVADPDLERRKKQLEKAVWALGRLRQVGPLQVRTIHETDWANAWKEHFFIHRVGERTVIVPSWRESEFTPREGDIALLLDPGMAFGTGLHPTTRLCLRLVEELVDYEAGQRVLDVGAGSGILSIAAARLGAAYVEAVEIEPVAAQVCRDNVQRNGVPVTVVQGTLEAPPAEPFDLLLANITIRVLLELHELLRASLRPRGRAVLSGVLAERSQELLDVLTRSGWQHDRTKQEQDWVAMLLTRL